MCRPASEPAIVDRIAALLGPNLDCFGTKFFPKLAGGTSTHWHQDNFYFKLSPPNCLTVWMALDPIDGSNGLLNYVPGSHLEGVQPHHGSNILGFSQSLIEWEGTDVQAREVAVGRE